jgi:hypothetical protein
MNMAEIDVVKKGSRAWVWVLLVIALALVLWFIVGMGDTPNTTGQLETAQPHGAAASLAASPGFATT